MSKQICARSGCQHELSGHDIANGICYCSRVCEQVGRLDTRDEIEEESDEE